MRSFSFLSFTFSYLAAFGEAFFLQKCPKKTPKTSVVLGENYVEKVGRDFMQREGFLQEILEVHKWFY